MARNDLIRLLTTLGILDYSGVKNEPDRHFGLTKQFKLYTLTDFMPAVIPEKLLFFSQLDENLLTGINNLYVTLVNLWNVDAVLHELPVISLAKFQDNPFLYINKIADRGFNVKYAIDQIQPAYVKVINSQVTLTRSEIDKYLEIVTTTINQVNEQVHLILANIIKSALPYEIESRDEKSSSVRNTSDLWKKYESQCEESGHPIIELTSPVEESNRRIMICNGARKHDVLLQGTFSLERVIIINAEAQEQELFIDYEICLIALQHEYPQSSIVDFVKFIKFFVERMTEPG